MKITKSYLRQVIMEELQKEVNPVGAPVMPARLNVVSGELLLKGITDQAAKKAVQSAMQRQTKGFWIGLTPGGNVAVFGMTNIDPEQAASQLRNKRIKSYKDLFPNNSTAAIVEFPQGSLDQNVVRLG